MISQTGVPRPSGCPPWFGESADGGRILTKRERDGVKWCFTLDAGANVHFLYPQVDKDAAIQFIETELKQYCENGAFIHDEVGMGAERI